MSHRKLIAGGLLLVAIFTSLVVVGERARRGTQAVSEQKSVGPRIELVRLKPRGNPSGDVECDSFAFVDFTYQISNRGEVPLSGLKLGTRCACEQVGSPPKELLPGESGKINFRVRAPYVGKMQRKIPLVVDGARETLAVFDVSLHVKFEPPKLIPPPNGLGFTFVAGDHSAHELVLEAIEATGSKRWIDAVEVNPAEGIELRPLLVDELPEADPALLRRRYRFPLANKSLPIGAHSATVTIQTAESTRRIADPLMIRIAVTDPVAIVPNPLVFRYRQGSPPPSRRVRIVNRSRHQTNATPLEYDGNLLRVEASSARPAAMPTSISPPLKRFPQPRRPR